MNNNNDNYNVGFGKPPKSTRFKTGQSGNPKGRPKKSKNTYDILKSELDQEILLKEGGKEICLTKRQAILRHMLHKAVKGDSKSMFFVYAQLLAVEVNDKQKQELQNMFADGDSKILADFLQNNLTNTNNKDEQNDN